MADEKKDPQPEKKVFAEGRGKYSLLESTKVFQFEFPLTATLEENYAAISYLRNEIFKAMDEQRKKEEANKKDKVEENKS